MSNMVMSVVFFPEQGGYFLVALIIQKTVKLLLQMRLVVITHRLSPFGGKGVILGPYRTLCEIFYDNFSSRAY